MTDQYDELVEQHIIHRLDPAVIAHNHGRLISALLKMETDTWLCHAPEGRILEIGASFGPMTEILRQKMREVHPIDIDHEAIKLGKSFLGIDIYSESIYDMAPSSGKFSAALLRDVVSHLDAHLWMPKLVEFGVDTVVIIDSNLSNMMLRVSRRLIGHEEHNELPLTDYVAQMNAHGFRLRGVNYSQFVGFPLSGGYLVRQFLPRALEPAVLWLERFIDRVLVSDAARKLLAWRWCAIFTR